MTSKMDDKKLWRDFNHTISVVTARALSQYDQVVSQGLGEKPWLDARRFEFSLLAASDGDVKITKTELLSEDGALSAKVEERADEIWLTLQLKGYSALSENAEHEARLVSANGAIDYRFRFNQKGQAVCVLADKPDVRDGIKSFSVFVQRDGQSGE